MRPNTCRQIVGCLLLAGWAVLPARAATHPALAFSSFLGGGGSSYDYETAQAVALDRAGNAYLVGASDSPGFPFTMLLGATPGSRAGYVTKVAAAGDHLAYSTLIAGAYPEAIAVDPAGNAYVAGYTYPGALSTTNAVQTVAGGNMDAFIAKLSPDGSKLLYCTYLGGDGLDMATAIAVDGFGNVFVTGWTTSTNFPVSPGALQPVLAGSFDAFVASLDATGRLRFATYLGGSGDDHGAGLALDPQGGVYVTGPTASTNFMSGPTPHLLGKAGLPGGESDAFVAKLSGDGSKMIYLALVGGSSAEDAAAIAVDSQGGAYIYGNTTSDDFPVTANCLQPARRGGINNPNGFAAKLSPAGDGLVYATYFGGSGSEAFVDPVYAQDFELDGVLIGATYLLLERAGVAVDAQGNAYLGARTDSGDISAGDAPATVKAGNNSCFVAKLNADATALLWFEYLGGSQEAAIEGVALSSAGLWVAGGTAFCAIPPQFPVTTGAFQPQYGGNVADAFVARLAEPPPVPANDNFAGRIPLAGTFLTAQGDNTSATLEPGEPAHGAGGGGHSVWWSWTAPTSGRLVVTTSGTGFDAALDVYTGGGLGSLVAVGTNNLAVPGDNFSWLEFDVTRGVEYQIAVDGAGGATGVIRLTLMLSTAANDDFARRFILTGFPVATNGSNVGATRELAEATPFQSRASVWWEWTAPFYGNVSISTDGSDFDTVLAVYTNNPSSGALVASDDNHDGLLTSEVNVLAEGGTTYYIVVGGAYTETGNIRLSIGPGAPPSNDNFTNAITLSGLSVVTTGNNAQATVEPGEPSLNYPNPANQTVWWNWTAATNGYALISTLGSAFDTRLGVFTGNALTNLVLVAGNDNWTGLTSQVYFHVSAGTTYDLMVDGNYYNSQGKIQLSIQLKVPSLINLNSVARLASGGLRFQVASPSGATARIETSTNLVDWTTPPGVVVPDGVFSDTDAAPGAIRFYRAVTVQ